MNFFNACLEGNFSQVKHLSSLTDIDEKDFYGNTGLSLSVKKGHKSVAEYLLNIGSNPNSTNHTRQTPLHLACSFNNIDCVNLLIRYKADVNIQDVSGSTPLMIATKKNFIQIVDILLSAGADPKLADRYGKSPLNRSRNIEISTMIQTCKNKKIGKKRSKSALVYSRLLCSFNESEWKKSKVGNKVQRKIKDRIGEVKNSLLAKCLGWMNSQLEEGLATAQNEIKQGIEKWTFVHSIRFENDGRKMINSIPEQNFKAISIELFSQEAKKGLPNFRSALQRKFRSEIKSNIHSMLLKIKNEIFLNASAVIKRSYNDLE